MDRYTYVESIHQKLFQKNRQNAPHVWCIIYVHNKNFFKLHYTRLHLYICMAKMRNVALQKKHILYIHHTTNVEIGSRNSGFFTKFTIRVQNNILKVIKNFKQILCVHFLLSHFTVCVVCTLLYTIGLFLRSKLNIN